MIQATRDDRPHGLHRAPLCLPGVHVLAVNDDRIRHQHDVQFYVSAASIPDAVEMLKKFVSDLVKVGGVYDDEEDDDSPLLEVCPASERESELLTSAAELAGSPSFSAWALESIRREAEAVLLEKAPDLGEEFAASFVV